MNFFKKFNKLDFNNKSNNKKKILSLIFTVFGVALLITGTSAAYLMTQVEGSNNTLTAGSLVLTFNNESSGITLNGVLPMKDEVGLNQSTSYTFTLQNSGSLKTSYEIYLKNNCNTSNAVTIDGESITPDVCIPNEFVKVAIKKNSGNYKIINLNNEGLLLKGIIDSSKTINFELKLWLDENTPNEYNGIKNEVSRNVLYYGNIKLIGKQFTNQEPNAPILASNMIPVYYDSTDAVWKKADVNNNDETNKWYSYNNKMWANAVTVTDTKRSTYLNASVGTPILMDDINTMFVWIPRFVAEGNTDTYTGAFDITFVDNKMPAHDAFTFGNKELNGFWVGKFENSSSISCTAASNSAVGEGCNLTTIRPKVIPNVTSWRGAQVSTYFDSILNMKENNNQYGFTSSEVDTHMMKNSEWGAVTYLTHSLYGRCSSLTSCTRVELNDSSTYITGYGTGGTSAVSELSTSKTKPKVILLAPPPLINDSGDLYNTSVGTGSSTTGNIYGIYDMAGGSNDYVMGLYWDGTESGKPDIDSKYYNLYTNTGNSNSPVTNYNQELQHALTETVEWYTDEFPCFFVAGAGSYFARGSSSTGYERKNIFGYNSYNGAAYINNGSRSVIVIN